MSRPSYLLDTSFLIDLANEVESGTAGPALRALAALPSGRFFVSPVTVAEILEGAEDPGEAIFELSKYQHQTLGWAAAQRCALNQSRTSRRMGENDAWQAALSVVSGHRLIGHDHGFERRPWLDYVDHRKY
ncbi:putative nucleic acid-binding protein [Opitutaceae bacterium TAV1]|nr:putative nucleic acid-binding protein [Opitutaceae bacterium TAV1]